jgi:hypothetical protein
MQLLSLIQMQDLLRVGRPGSIFGCVREGSIAACSVWANLGFFFLGWTVPSFHMIHISFNLLRTPCWKSKVLCACSEFWLDFVCAVLLDSTTAATCIRVCNIYMDLCVQLIFPDKCEVGEVYKSIGCTRTVGYVGFHHYYSGKIHLDYS